VSATLGRTDRLVDISGQTLECRLIALHPSSATLVFLHEGLGSVALWGDWPEKLAAQVGLNALIYSRKGYGRSSRLDAPRTSDFMHREAFDVLPRLLDKLEIERPVIVGHSDGGSIGLLFASRPEHRTRAAVIMAPHVLVEAISIDAITAARAAYLEGELRARLKRYHEDVDGAFFGWNDIWLNPDFVHWNIERELDTIDCPTLAIQGTADEYGTMQQIELITRRVKGSVALQLEGCRHSPHRDRSDQVIASIAQFLSRSGVTG
jgi:pimeloyl-ACP methyl ester carboxylesterase